MGIFIVLALSATAWVGVRAALAQGHLESARSTAATVQGSLLTDLDSTRSALETLAADTTAARQLTSDPIWRAFEALPWGGPQLRAASTLAASLDDVVVGSITPLMGSLEGIGADSFAPTNGAVDLAPLLAIRDVAATAATRATEANQRAASIDTAPLLGTLRGPVEEGTAQLRQLADGITALHNATELLPAMLGADGPRDYLLLFQNNAEWRSLGGIAGTMALLHTDNGAIRLTDQKSSTGFKSENTPVLDIDPDITAVFDSRVARHVQNSTQVPDFTVTAALAQEFWHRAGGGDVDGVISLDPVALSYLLAATGPIKLATGDTLTSDNAVQLLLNEVYIRYPDPLAQDAFFAQATVAIFDALADGSTDPTTLLQGLSRAGSEHRLFIWNAASDEQAVLDGTTLQGTLPATDGETTRIGVYLNDGTGSKLDYYMSAGATASWCSTAGIASTATVHVELHSDVPADPTSLPNYLLARSSEDPAVTFTGTPIGIVRTAAYIYLPDGASVIGQESSSGEAAPRGWHGDQQVLAWWSDLAPGETATLDLAVQMPYTTDIETRLTPVIHEIDPTELALSCAGGR